MILTKERLEELRRLENAGYVGGTRTKIADINDTITDLESRLKAATERARIIEEMYDQEYGLEHGGVAKQLNQVQAAYERGLRDAADVLDAEVRYHMKNNGAHGFCEDYGCTNLTEFAKQILALKDRGAK